MIRALLFFGVASAPMLATPSAAAPPSDALAEWGLLSTEADVELTWLGSDWARAAPIVNGSVTEGFPSVVALGIEMQGGVGTFCSGTVVAERYVITAAHCVDALVDYQRQGATGVVAFGSDLSLSVSHVRDIVAATSHPGWTRSLDDGADIAVLEMDSGVAEVTPMPVADCDCDLRRPEELDYVGFGITGDGRRDAGVKRVAAIDFHEVQGDFLISRDPEQNLCSGDSGGAALRRVGDGHELVGVNSFVFDIAGDGTVCLTGGSGATRVAPFIDWLDTLVEWDVPPETGGTDVDPEAGGTDGTDGGTDQGGTDTEGTDPGGTDGGTDGGSTDGGDDPGTGGAGALPEISPLGCACSTSTPAGGLGALALVGLIGLLRRRR